MHLTLTHYVKTFLSLVSPSAPERMQMSGAYATHYIASNDHFRSLCLGMGAMHLMAEVYGC